MFIKMPPKLKSDAMRLVPLGGLGEVGRNMMTVEYKGKILILDCGVLFPRDEEPGVDLILPDFSYLVDHLHSIEAVVISHGHEDHIGALPYLLEMREDIPIIGSQFSLALVKNKLKQFNLKGNLRVVKEKQTYKAGDFDLEFISANHSIPDALCIYVKTDAGSVLFTGDIKLDQTPLDKRITDINHLAEISKKGVDLFLVDSTNAEVPGTIPTESAIAPSLDIIFHKAKGKIVVASFASHVHRVQQIIDTAKEYGRKVCLVGFSMIKTMTLAAELGYLKIPKNTIVELNNLDKLPDDKVVLMCTGSQGEPMAALSRISRGDHTKIKVKTGDAIIFASSLIPGNEKSISQVINDLTVLGVDVFHNKNAHVHVSGHAAQTELLYLYNTVRPKNVLPVHGEPRHLAANSRLAEKVGIKSVKSALNGAVIDLQNGRVKQVGQVRNDYIYVDGRAVGEIDEADLQTRKILASEGFITCSVVIDSKNKVIVAGPEITVKGVAEDLSVFDEVKGRLVKELNIALSQNILQTSKLSKITRRTLGAFIFHKLKRAPIIVPIVNLIK
ncbi:MAG: ribonuclease J [Bifidobacteriaceae bacterium]|jgi:ribonuclease J|nr:ribonuclease J [Bifidobacteriaceae bacterium]